MKETNGLEKKESMLKENNEALVTIVCTVFNHEKYIEKAIKGFLMQRCSFKYIVYIQDDCSTDNSAEIIKDYEKRYPDIIKGYYLNENIYSQGISPLFNLIEKVNSKYIAVCEGDDFWIDEYKLQKQIDFLEKNNDYVATYHNVKCIDVINNVEKESKMYPFEKSHDCTIEDAKNLKLNGQTASLVCKNIFMKMSNEEKKSYNECTANGDVKMSVTFCYLGNVHYFSDVMAIHPRYFEGDSWTAKTHNKNLSMFQYNSIITINKYIKDVFNDCIYVDVLMTNLIFNMIVQLVKKKSIDDWHIFIEIKHSAKIGWMKIISEVLNRIINKIQEKSI